MVNTEQSAVCDLRPPWEEQSAVCDPPSRAECGIIAIIDSDHSPDVDVSPLSSYDSWQTGSSVMNIMTTFSDITSRTLTAPALGRRRDDLACWLTGTDESPPLSWLPDRLILTLSPVTAHSFTGGQLHQLTTTTLALLKLLSYKWWNWFNFLQMSPSPVHYKSIPTDMILVDRNRSS